MTDAGRALGRMADEVAERLRRLSARLGLEAVLPAVSYEDEGLEDAVESVLRPIGPSADFRRNLGENLSFAAQRRMAGLVVEMPRPMREGLVLGIAAGALALGLAMLFVVLRCRGTLR